MKIFISKVFMDIEKIFGVNVRKIVDYVTEIKSLPWDERKMEAINRIKNASYEGKMVECADKVNNLETLYDLYLQQGDKIWENFNKPKEKQKWYYTEMYKAVMQNIEENELTLRYKNILEKMEYNLLE